MLFRRLELLIEGKSAAAALFSGPYYLVEQLGFRKVIDTTFMIAAMINGSPDPEDVRRYFRALKRAQRDIDLRPELYTHYYRNEFPERFHAMMDTRRWGPGERIVFETLLARGLRAIVRLDRRARDLRRRPHGLGRLRQGDRFLRHDLKGLTASRTRALLHPPEAHALAVGQAGGDIAAGETGLALGHLLLRAAQAVPP